MNVNTIIIPTETALAKLDSYRALTTKQRTAEDEELLKIYSAVRFGKRVLHLTKAFMQTGLNERGQPRLALARADWRNVFFRPRASSYVWDDSHSGAGSFSCKSLYKEIATSQYFVVPKNVFADSALTRNRLFSPVPHIPPELRPKFSLSNYWILFEAAWEEYPVDPFLLKRIGSTQFFIVEAEWELTELEASLLADLRAD